MQSVTIKKVANQAGCSAMTVSNVLNRKGKVSKELSDRVMQAINELGYRPNQAARKLVGKRGIGRGQLRRFGCVVPGSQDKYGDPYYGEMLGAIEEELRRRNYNLVFIENEKEFEDELRREELLDEVNVDGLIVLDCSPEFLDLAGKYSCNVVRVGACVSNPDIDYVSCNMVQAGREATEYLIDRGHKNIAYFGFKLDEKFARTEREGGYRLAMAAGATPLSTKSFYTTEPFSPNSAYEDATAMLKEHPELTAVFCHNDMVASMVVKAAWNMGRKIPEDLSVIGFNDDAIASLCNPALTTVRVNKKDIGRVVAQCAVERIENPELPPRMILLQCQLIERESCGSAK